MRLPPYSFHFRKAAPALVLAGLWAGCAPEGPGPGMDGGDPIHAGMRVINSRGRTFLQGAVGDFRGPLETPAIRNGFSYDFWMDSAEVTQGGFERVMGWNPVDTSSPFGRGSLHPVYRVSWYDAVLYCNARSRMAGLDTVYAYTRVQRTPRGGVYAMEGLSVRLGRSGFRLPTEAEWEFAAQAGSQGVYPWGNLADSASVGRYAWHSGNSRNACRPVAGLQPNAFGLYDMAGNVMEWVNDWKGRYPDSGALDFAGSRDPGPVPEKPVKGGAFNHGLKELRPANRSATYAAIPSAVSEYVGFRCVAAAIAAPRYSSAEGGWLGTDPVALIINRLRGYLAGRASKLVFVNASPGQRNLVYVDYGRVPAAMREFTDMQAVFHPSISPDGNWVAFGTGLEGSEGASTLFVRPLDGSSSPALALGAGFIPRWWVDPAAADTFLVYTNSAADNGTPRWSATQTLAQKMRGGEPAGAPAALTVDGGFHDGRSRDGRYLATGFTRLQLRDLRTGSTRILFTSPRNGKGEGDTSQVCNVSISPDSSGSTLFLDFGHPVPSRLTGASYGIHQVAFLADAAGNVKRWYRAPREEASWDDLEWSNHPDFAVAGARDDAGSHRNLYLLNLKDSAYTRLAQGTMLIQPALWLGPASIDPPIDSLDLDSLGHYNDPETDVYQAFFSAKMTRFWKAAPDLELVFMGSSHVQSGIDPHRFTRLKAFNLGFPANGWLGSQILALDYALAHCPKLKVVAMEVLPGWMIFPGADVNWNPNLAKTKGVLYDQSHGFWKDGLPLRFAELVGRAPNATWEDIDSIGFQFSPSMGWGPADLLHKVYRNDWDVSDPQYRENLEQIARMAALLSERKIHLVLVNFPNSPGYRQSDYYQKFGPGWSASRGIIRDIGDLGKTSPYVHFYDAYAFGEHDYGDGDAHNGDHLSSQGAAKLTGRLDSLVNAFPGVGDLDHH